MQVDEYPFTLLVAMLTRLLAKYTPQISVHIKLYEEAEMLHFSMEASPIDLTILNGAFDNFRDVLTDILDDAGLRAELSMSETFFFRVSAQIHTLTPAAVHAQSILIAKLMLRAFRDAAAAIL